MIVLYLDDDDNGVDADVEVSVDHLGQEIEGPPVVSQDDADPPV